MNTAYLSQYLAGVVIGKHPDDVPAAGDLADMIQTALDTLAESPMATWVIRRDDGEDMFGEYSHQLVDGADDWEVCDAESSCSDGPVEYRMLHLVPITEHTRTYHDGERVAP